LVLADKLGTSLADTLRAQADSLRTRLRQSAEETGGPKLGQNAEPTGAVHFSGPVHRHPRTGFISILKNFSGLTDMRPVKENS
jgi:hypothetical protein